jgi:hypothetical protein
MAAVLMAVQGRPAGGLHQSQGSGYHVGTNLWKSSLLAERAANFQMTRLFFTIVSLTTSQCRNSGHGRYMARLNS